MTNKKQLLAIDARPLSRGTGGIQRYLDKLLTYLIADSNFEIILYSDHPIKTILKFDSKNVKTRYAEHKLGRSMAWHYLVCLWVAKDQPNIFWSPRHHLPFILPRATKRIVTIHDFVWKTCPFTMPKLQLISEKLLMPFAIKKATQIICISQTTQAQLEKFYPDHVTKSSVILHGAYKSKNSAKHSSNDEPGYFLAVGTLEPRKNYERLINAYDQYVKNGGIKNLIIVGKFGWQYSSILSALNNIDNHDRIKIHQSASDHELSEHYSRACGFVSPSLDEGYGLPPQEAIHYELPLLLSDIEVYRELYPDASLWADPLSTNDLTSGLHKLEKLPKTKSSVMNKVEHNWRDCAKQHNEVFCS